MKFADCLKRSRSTTLSEQGQAIIHAKNENRESIVEISSDSETRTIASREEENNFRIWEEDRTFKASNGLLSINPIADPLNFELHNRETMSMMSFTVETFLIRFLAFNVHKECMHEFAHVCTLVYESPAGRIHVRLFTHSRPFAIRSIRVALTFAHLHLHTCETHTHTYMDA